MSALPEGVEPAAPPAPRPSALGVVLRREATGWKCLLGRRARRARFMAGQLAFPGGALEEVDGPERPGAFARCVSREVREETGLALEPERWYEAGERTTPPIFPLRFRALLFVAEAPDGWWPPDPPPRPEENETLAFHDPADALAAFEGGAASVAPPVLPVLRALAGVPSRAPLPEVASALRAASVREERVPRIEFVPKLWMLPVSSRTLPPATHTNVWLPGWPDFLVVDPGSGEEAECARLLQVVERRCREAGGGPRAVLLTHHHPDHAAGAQAVARALRVPLWAHGETLARLDARAVEGSVGVRRLEDGEQLQLGEETWRVVHTPGHAPGHLALYEPERRLLLAGDLVSGLSTILIEPGDGDLAAYLRSLERVAALPLARVLPAHGPPLPPAALSRLHAHRLERERRVLEALGGGGGYPAAAVAARAYAGEPVPRALAERQTLAHLEKLRREGRAERAADGTWRLGGCVDIPRGSR